MCLVSTVKWQEKPSILVSCEGLLRGLFFIALTWAGKATCAGTNLTYRFYTASPVADGALPTGSLTSDGRGNLYGTASTAGNAGGSCPTQGCGAVFQLKNKNGSWLFTPLFDFPADVESPVKVIFLPENSRHHGCAVLSRTPHTERRCMLPCVGREQPIEVGLKRGS